MTVNVPAVPSSAPRRPGRWLQSLVRLIYPSLATQKDLSASGLRYIGQSAGDYWKTWTSIIRQLTPSIACTGILVAAIVLGRKRVQWPLTPKTIGSIEVDQDLQLILIGVVNKSLDVIVQAVLEDMARMYNTLWMLPSGQGATMQDTLIKNEMAKPWAAVRAYWRRKHAAGLRAWGSIVRLILTLGISSSVMLLGAGLNTIGWPKQRWYPDHVREMNLTEHSSSDLTIHTPLQTIESIDWAEDMRAGLALVGGVPHLDENGSPVLTSGAADEIAGAIAASTAFFALTRLPGAYNRSPPDWLNVWDTPAYQTGIQTRINGSTVQSISVQSQRIVDLFKYQQVHGKSFAKTATGFHAILQMTTPSLITTCADLVPDDVAENAVEVRKPDDDNASFAVHIGASQGLKFSGATCNLMLSQALAPVETWITDLGAPWMDLHNITAPISLVLLPIDTATADILMATRLAAHFKALMPMLNGQVPSNGIVPHLVMATRMLQAQHSGFKTDNAAMSAVIATLAQQQLSTATWTLRSDEDHLIASAPVHWQLYGSGPRMKWEWMAMTVLVIILLVMLNHIGLLLVYRFQPGEWLDLGGMLRVARLTKDQLCAADEVHAGGLLREREDIAKNADDMIRYKVKADRDEWPVLVESRIPAGWVTKRRRPQCRQTQSVNMSTIPPSPQVPLTSITSASVSGVGSTPAFSTAVPPSSSSASSSFLASAPVTANPPPSVSSTTLLIVVATPSGAANASTMSPSSSSSAPNAG